MLFLILSEEDNSKMVQLFKTYEKPVAYYLYKFLKDEQLAEDALQNVFMKLMKNLEKIQGVESKETKNFVYMVAKNIAINFFNKRKKENENIALYDDEVLSFIDERSATEIIAKQDMNGQLEEGIKELREEDREIIVLKYGLDWSNERIAQHYEITEEAVRKRASRARMRLAEVIKKNKAETKENEV